MDTAATFVTDRGFLVPSLVAARQLKSFGIDQVADLLIYLIDDDPDFVRQVARDFGTEVNILPLESRAFLPKDMSKFHVNHVPVATLARLVIGDALDPGYRNIVYLDGDVQVLDDPTPLFTRSVPAGKIAAAPGSEWLNKLTGAPTYEDMEAHGLDADTYFNAGVLAVSADTWRDMAPRALRLMLEAPEKYKVHDQTVLNIVFSGNILPLSPLYNFHHVYAETGITKDVTPKIVHFTGPSKPWSGFPPPWFGSFRHQYATILQQHPYLQDTLTLSRLGSRKQIKAYWQTIRSTLNGPQRKRLAERKKAIADRIAQPSFTS